MIIPRQGAHSKFKSKLFSAIKDHFSRTKNKARQYGSRWNIPLAVFAAMIQRECFYCGESPKNKYFYRPGGITMLYQGIDRVNSKIGYTLGNVVPCCKKCNTVKSDILSGQEMYAAMRVIKKLRSSIKK